MALPTLLDRHLVFVTGKGGAGKSTVAALLALLASRAGKRVLVCEVNAPEARVAPLLGGSTASGMQQVRPRVHTLNVVPTEAMREYGLMVLRFKAVYHAVFENRLVRHFLRVVPALSELVTLGKILHEARALQPDGRPRWDLVLVDAPATGHALQLLRVPSALLDTVPAGPLRHDAEWMERLLTDPVKTAVALVTLPEELPVSEAIELDAQLKGVLRMKRAVLLVNAMPQTRFGKEEASTLLALSNEPRPLGPAAQAAHLSARRVEEAERQLARARAAIDLPSLVLPLLPAAEWGEKQVEALLSAAGQALSPGGGA